MIRRWIWIAFALIPLDTLLAQQSPKTKLTVQVTDVTGASVPNAMIEIGGATSHDATLAAEADRFGKGEFDLPLGKHQLLVKSPGFCPYTLLVDALKQQNQAITAKLQIDSCPGPCAGPCIGVTPEAEIRSAQLPLRGLLIKVTDTSGAVLPGARIQITRSSDDTKIAAATGSAGQAQIPLDAGIYELRVQARGFQVWEEKELEVEGETRRDVTLLISNLPLGPNVEPEDKARLALDRQPLTAEVPSIPMELLDLSARPIRSRRRWF